MVSFLFQSCELSLVRNPENGKTINVGKHNRRVNNTFQLFLSADDGFFPFGRGTFPQFLNGEVLAAGSGGEGHRYDQ